MRSEQFWETEHTVGSGSQAVITYDIGLNEPVPDEQNDDGSYRGTDQSCSLSDTIKPCSISDNGGQKRACNTEHRCQYEPFRIVWARHDKPGDYTRYKPNQNDPECDTHSCAPI